MGVTRPQMTEIENRYRVYKVLYCSDLTLGTDRVLTDAEVVQVEIRIDLLEQIKESFYSGEQDTDASLIARLIGDLRGRLLSNNRMREMDLDGEPERWRNLSEPKETTGV